MTMHRDFARGMRVIVYNARLPPPRLSLHAAAALSALLERLYAANRYRT